jgi:hypothetical protein
VRVFAQHLVRPQAHQLQRLFHQPPRAAAIPRQMEIADDQPQDGIDAVEGIEDLKGILEDRLHVPPELLPQPPPQGLKVTAAVPDGAGRGRQKTQDQARQGGLATAALAGDGDDPRGRLRDHQREAVQGHRPPAVEQPLLIDLRDVVYLK